jgi:anion-transporting  ArsA/GET3 family ATPase
MDLDRVLDDPRTKVIVCCGSGGVGKTTTAAAIAVRAAERGRTTVVLTIDPARRLAQSLGLQELDNTPRPVVGVNGRLDAMMLDMKRTFDDVVLASSGPEKAQAVLDNPFYQALSSSFAGTQEYMAMEKLAQLRRDGSWDLVVVDTPPTRSALDFLDAPDNLSRFLDGRLVRLLMAPARASGKVSLKVFSAGFGLVSRVVTKILGGQLLSDVSQFVSSLDTMFGGFRERAKETYETLTSPGTAFILVATPEAAALREAAFFADRLATEGLPLAGLVLNRVHLSDAGLAADRTRMAADAATGLARAALQVHLERQVATDADAHLSDRFTRSHPEVAVAVVRARAEDVHDLAGLRSVGEELAGAVTNDLSGAGSYP